MSRSPKNLNLAARLLRYSSVYWPWLLLALFLILSMSGLLNYLPVLIKRIIDDCLISSTAPASERVHLLGRLSLFYLIMAGVGYLLRYAQGVLTAWLGQRIVSDLRMDVFKKILHLHQGHFDRTPVGSLLTRVTSDIERLQGFVTEGVVGTVADLFMLGGIMTYMLIINVHVACALFVTLPIIFTILFFINRYLREANRQIRKKQTALNVVLQEDLTGMTTIQLFNREARAQEDFNEKNRALRTAYFEEVRWFSSYFPVIEGGQILSVLLILAAGGMLILSGNLLISLGVLIAFLTYTSEFFRPLSSLSDKAGLFQAAMVSAERIFALLDTPTEIVDPADPLPAEQIRGTLIFDRVWFAYQEENWVIKDLSFSVEPGQVLAVVGATGAGKSTLINLMGRFYDIQRGSITLDGKPLGAFSQTDLRRRLGYVFQDPFLFAGSIADNVSLLNPDLTREDLVRAATAVNAHRFIAALPDGYDTILNERGEGLSLGQKQLLSMARALAQNPDLLFILDEATASVDTATEWLIQNALGRLMKERTCIVIAHRLSTIRHADCILVMRHGELVDQGTHDELMARDGYYRHLYELLQHDPAKQKK